MTIYWKPTGSLDLSTDPTSLPGELDGNNEFSGAMQRCKNLRLDETGKISLRDGSNVLDSSLENAVHKIIEQAGDRYVFAGDKIYKNGTSIESGLTSAQWTGILYNSYAATANNVFALNGTDRKRIEGSNVYEWGITAPATAPTLAVGSLNGLSDDYNAKYTYCRKEGSVVVCESDPSPAGTAVTLANESLDITWTASSDSQVTHVRIYRTLTDGLIYYHDQDVAIGTTTLDTNTADTALGTEVSTDHDRPPLGKFVIGPNYNGTCFIIKDNLLYYCSSKQPEYWPTLNYIEIASRQFPGQTAVFWNGQLYYFTKNDIYLIQGTGTGTFFPLPMSAETGARGHMGAVAVTGVGIYHLGVDGIYLYSSGNDKKITHTSMERIFRGETVGGVPGLNRSRIDDSWLIAFQGKIYFGYVDASGIYPDNVIVFDRNTNKMTYFNYGHVLRAMAVDKTNNRLLGGDSSGNIYHLENKEKTRDSSTAIEWETQTKDFTLQTRKNFPRFCKYDVDASNAVSAKGEVILDDVVLQSHVITGDRQTKRRLITTGNGDRISVRISGSGPVSIHAMEIE